MIISSGKPEQLVEWFHNWQNELRVLCILLAPDETDLKNIAALVEHPYAADARLGKNLGFLVLLKEGDKLNIDHRYRSNEHGLDNPAKPRPLSIDLQNSEAREYGAFLGIYLPLNDWAEGNGVQSLRSIESNYRAAVANKAAEAMAYYVPELMEIFKVDHNQLPTLCVLVKGINKAAILPLGNDWNNDSLVNMLGLIHNIANDVPDFQAEYTQLKDEAIPAIKTSTKRDQKINTIKNKLEGLIRKEEGNHDDRKLAAEFIQITSSMGNVDIERFEFVLKQFSFFKNVDYSNHIIVKQLKTKLGELEGLQKIMQDEIKIDQRFATVSELTKQIHNQREKLFKEIQNLGDVKLVNTPNNPTLVELLKKFAQAIYQATKYGADLTDPINKISKAAEVIEGLFN